MNDRFPGLSPKLHPLAERAESLGLRLTYFNSGSSRNPSNGARIFRDAGKSRDFFEIDFLVHISPSGNVYEKIGLFLAGYASALESTR